MVADERVAGQNKQNAPKYVQACVGVLWGIPWAMRKATRTSPGGKTVRMRRQLRKSMCVRSTTVEIYKVLLRNTVAVVGGGGGGGRVQSN